MIARSTQLAACALAALLFAVPAHAQLPSSTLRDNPSGVDLTGAIADSFKLLGLEHATRIAFQQKTRDALEGPFWDDYVRSLRVPHRWEDGDSWLVNYLGHPVHGAAAGYIWLDHEAGAPTEIALSGRYWASRARALAWAAGYSAQFEFGPLSEASIGNVGLDPGTTGWVDHVVTPVVGFGLIVAEDALDRFFVRWVEERVGNRFLKATLRMAFNPGRTLSNTSQGHLPWHRAGRPLSGSPD